MQRADRNALWRNLVAPHLLDHLLIGGQQQRQTLAPVWLLGLTWATIIIALAGPAWQHEPAPFAEERAALVIALKAAPSMLAQDVLPSRLERAVHKIGDLVERRPGALTALIAYAGSAHRVMPLTRDGKIIAQFAAELTPEIMPRDGDDPLAAIDLALNEFERAAVPGSVLLITDGLPADSDSSVAERAQAAGISLHVLAVAAGPEVAPPPGSPPAPALDREAGQAASRALGASWTEVSVDDSDVAALERAFETRIAQAESEESQWRDAGYLLLPLIVCFALVWFRRGWRLEVA
ncbi:MAG: VWA domain-containing protein [Candidatus Competibacteraceae bacterium]|nr:VWA domain-containing protein [Candidatus Competibacteraceae bacterium]